MPNILPGPGRFIVIEGPNHAGKSTLARQLAEFLISNGSDVISTREPGGTPFATGLRHVLKDPACTTDAYSSALLFSAARSDHIHRTVAPAVRDGKLCLCDRYIPSTDIYQCQLGTGINDRQRKAVEGIHALLPVPHLTIFVVPDAGLYATRLRQAAQETDRFEGNPRELDAYVRYAAAYSLNKAILRPTLSSQGNILNHLLAKPSFIAAVGPLLPRSMQVAA